MSFQIITAETRTQRMIDWFSGICKTITDFLPGSKIRTKFETVAVEMESQDFAFFQAMKRAIPVSVYKAFSFNLNPPVKATGTVVFTANTPAAATILIQKGTRLSTVATETQPEIAYEVASDTYLLLGDTTVVAYVVASNAGVSGNTPANTITVIKTAITGIDSVTNQSAISSGVDRETEESRRTRFIAYINTLSRATISGIEYGAKTARLVDADGNVTEQVAFAKLYEPFTHDQNLQPGVVTCYIYNGHGNTSNELVAETKRVIDGYVATDGTLVAGYKSAGIVCDVVKATEITANVTINIKAHSYTTDTDKSTIKTTAEEYVAGHIATLNVGDSLRQNKIVDIVMSITGVYDINSVVINGAVQQALTANEYEVITSGNVVATVI